MDADTEACKLSDNMFIVWMRHLNKNKTDQLAARLAFQHCGWELMLNTFHKDSFNCCYRVHFTNGPDVLVRFPALGRSMFRREKVEDEIAVMRYIRCHTSIPVPQVLGSGTSVVGLYMVLEFVEGTLLSEFLGASQVPMVSSTLKPDIDIAILRRAYHGMVKILLELPRCQFSAIGGLVQGKTGDISVEKRAVTSNMNELVGLGNFPPKRLLNTTFGMRPHTSNHLPMTTFTIWRRSGTTRSRTKQTTGRNPLRGGYSARLLDNPLTNDLTMARSH